MATTGSVRLLEGVCFEATSGTGHTVLMDGAHDSGGRDAGMRPMEMVLLGLGGCSAFDVVTILRRGRHAVSGCEVALEADRADEPPRVFTSIRLHYRVRGTGLPPRAVERAIELSRDKYCSASAMMAHTAKITTSFEIREEPADA